MNTFGNRVRSSVAATVAACVGAACTHFAISDCEDTLSHDVTRIRSSHVRMRIADTPAAAARFTPYAWMSAIAYFDGPGGRASVEPSSVKPKSSTQLATLFAALAATSVVHRGD